MREKDLRHVCCYFCDDCNQAEARRMFGQTEAQPILEAIKVISKTIITPEGYDKHQSIGLWPYAFNEAKSKASRAGENGAAIAGQIFDAMVEIPPAERTFSNVMDAIRSVKAVQNA